MSTNQKYMIIRDRVEIYKDFTFNLLYCIFDYYLDRQTLALDVDIKNHFMFCYNKVCSEFKKEEIDFSNNKELIDYFYAYYYHQFYKSSSDQPQQYFVKFWRDIFNIDKQRNKNLLKIMIELYSIFDKSITADKNILELV